MVVGVIQVSEEMLIRKAQDETLFREYCRDLVPKEYRHIQYIVDNQTYYCCLLLRKNKSVPWDLKRPLLDKVLLKLKIVGFTDSLIEAGSLLDYANISRVKTFGIKKV